MKMEFSDDEDFVLSQFSTCEFQDTQSFGFGEDVIAGINHVVSLEGNLDNDCGDLNESEVHACSSGDDPVCDGIDIEDITDDENGDKM